MGATPIPMIIRQDITTEELMAIDYRYRFTKQELMSDWYRLLFCTEFKAGAQFAPGIKLCKHFCDNFWEIEDRRGVSFASAWNDYGVMDSVREWGLRSMSKLWLSWVRRAVYMRAGLPNSSFYRPHLAKQVILLHGAEAGTLVDPCIGWGGRMLGTVASGWDYVGYDADERMVNNARAMADFVGATPSLTYAPAEYADFPQADVILTSPPYFDLERYSNDQDQSYNKYPQFDLWRDSWLIPLIRKGIESLSDGGLSAWNVMGRDLVAAVMDAHDGLELIATLGFKSPIANIRQVKNKDITLVFRKA